VSEREIKSEGESERECEKERVREKECNERERGSHSPAGGSPRGRGHEAPAAASPAAAPVAALAAAPEAAPAAAPACHHVIWCAMNFSSKSKSGM
jgi:hypothetical protein